MTRNTKEIKPGQYGPNQFFEILGFIILLIGTFFSFYAVLFLIIVLSTDSSLIFSITGEYFIFIILSFGTILVGIWILSIGYRITIIERKFFSRRGLLGTKKYHWKNYNNEFLLVIRSSQSELMDRISSTWDMEIWFSEPFTENVTKFDIPSIKKESDVVNFIRNLKNLAKAEPVQREINTGKIIGKEQKILFAVGPRRIQELRDESSKVKKKKRKQSLGLG